MFNTNNKNILIICEDPFRAKKIEYAMEDKICGKVVSSGIQALALIKNSTGYSDIFIPLDLEDMDYSDFIRFAKHHSPNSNYILIAPPNLTDLGWLVLSNEIDGYISEPLCVSKILSGLQNQKRGFGPPRSILLAGATIN